MGTNDKADKSPETDVTPEMIEAGMHEYASRWLALRDLDDSVARGCLRRLILQCMHFGLDLVVQFLKANAVLGNVAADFQNFFGCDVNELQSKPLPGGGL